MCRTAFLTVLIAVSFAMTGSAWAASADLTVTVSDSPDPVVAGNNLTYTVTVTNNGPTAADTASWSDTLPAGTTFVSVAGPGDWPCTTPAVGVGGTVSCGNTLFGAGSSAGFTLTVEVAPATPAETVLSNTVTVTSASSDPALGNNSGTATTTVSTSADLSATLLDSPDPVVAGQNLGYTLTLSNSGPSAASSASWSDTLPAGTTFVSVAGPGDWPCTTPAVGAGGTVTCTNPTVTVGPVPGFTLTVQVAPATPAGTVLSNTVTVTSATSDPTPANNSASATTTVSTLADLSTTVSDGPDPVVAGQNLGYTVTLSNAGPSAAASASWSDTVPAGTTFVSLVAAAGWSCSAPAVGAGGTVSCSNASFGVGSAVFAVVVQVARATPSGSVLSNTATVSTATSNPVSANDSSTAITGVSTAADRSIAIAGPANPVAAGADATYTIRLVQNGPSDADGVTVSITLPPSGAAFKSLAAASGFSCSTPAVGASGGTATCTAATLAPGTSAFTLVVHVPADTPSGSFSVVVSVTAATADPNPGAETASRTTTTTAAPAPMPTPTPGPSPVTCSGKPIVLIDVHLEGGRVHLSGLARPSFAGRRVKIAPGKGSAKVRADGSFSTMVAAPPAARRARTRYIATVAGKRSAALKLVRDFVIVSQRSTNTGVRVTAHVRGGHRGLKVRLSRQVTCKRKKLFATRRLDRHGRFSIVLPRPSRAGTIAFYGASARGGRHITFTLPIAVRHSG